MRSILCLAAFAGPVVSSFTVSEVRSPSFSPQILRRRCPSSQSSAVNGNQPELRSAESAGAATTTATTKLLQDFASDLARLEEVRPPIPSEDFSAPVAIISAGSSYTRLWTHETWKAHSREPLRRYVRHVASWPSSTTARKILPVVAASSIWSFLLSTAVRRCRPLKAVIGAAGPSAALSYLSAPLALLLTLRANASMSRIVEARLLWGRLLLHARALAGIVAAYLLEGRPRAAVLVARHLAALGWMLKASVRGETRESENQVLSILLGRSDREWVSVQPKRTVALLSRIRRISAASLATMEDTARLSAVLLLIEERIAELELCVGGCDRLFTSPIPPTYSRHLSRVMFLWLLLLPMSLVGMNLSTLGVMLPTAVATYCLVGLDEVGSEIESCFLLLPLQQLAAATHNGVKSQIVPNSGPMPTDEF
jgi:ion channel-forming bestrophin family protein